MREGHKARAGTLEIRLLSLESEHPSGWPASDKRSDTGNTAGAIVATFIGEEGAAKTSVRSQHLRLEPSHRWAE